MSRSGYTDDYDDEGMGGLWRGAVASSIRGKRGQAMLGELVQALDSLPNKRLVAESLVTEDGEFCALGALGRQRNMDMSKIDPDERDQVANAFGIAEALAAEVMYLNDEYSTPAHKWIDVEICGPVRPHYPDWGEHTHSIRVINEHAGEERWLYMRKWAIENLKETSAL